MKLLLTSLATLSIATSTLLAEQTKFYADENGQVFVKPAEGRTEIAPIKREDITIIKDSSENFLLGKETHINMKIRADDNRDMWLKAGVRIQSTFESVSEDGKDSYLDAYLRRTRFEIAASFGKKASFVMDVRNDKANYEDKGEQEFNVGDAYLKIKKPFGSSLTNFKLYRAKIDVSRTETVKSARVIHYDRPKVADEAAQFITHNRRGTNAQMYGNWNKKFHYQVAVGDGVHSGKLKDSLGKSIGEDIEQKSFFYGGKVVLSPFDGWEEKSRTETYMGKGKHFSVGASYWNSSNIDYDLGNEKTGTLNHELMNIEASMHYGGLFLGGEYFQFTDVVNGWSSDELKTGDSSGWYITGEYVIPQLSYLAPFFRYESWDKFEDADDALFTSSLFGVNWYLRGNTTKIGLVYQKDESGKDIGGGSEERVKVTSQWFF